MGSILSLITKMASSRSISLDISAAIGDLLVDCVLSSIWLLRIAQDFIMRLGFECHYQRSTSSLAIHHPFIAKKIEYSIAQLPPLFEPIKIAENTSSIKIVLKAMAFIIHNRRKNNCNFSIHSIDASPYKQIVAIKSLAFLDTPIEANAGIYKRRVISIGSSALHDAIIGDKNSHRQLKMFKTTEEFNTDDKISKHKTDFDAESTPKTLPVLDVTKRSIIIQTHSSGKSKDTSPQPIIPIKPTKISNFSKYGDSNSPPRKDRQIQEVLERIVQKDRESKEISSSVILKQTKDSEKVGRTNTIEHPLSSGRKSPRHESKFTFSSSRKSHGLAALKPKLNIQLVSTRGHETSRSTDLRKSSLARKLKEHTKTPTNNYFKEGKKFKIVSAKDRKSNQNTHITQEGGTVSTQDF